MVPTFNPRKAKEDELDLLTDAIDHEHKHKEMEAKDHIKKLQVEQYAFLTKYENLSQHIISIPSRTDSEKPLEKYYIIFESVASTL